MNEAMLETYKLQVKEMEIMLDIMEKETYYNSQVQRDEIEKLKFGLRCAKVRIKQLEELVETEDEEA